MSEVLDDPPPIAAAVSTSVKMPASAVPLVSPEPMSEDTLLERLVRLLFRSH